MKRTFGLAAAVLGLTAACAPSISIHSEFDPEVVPHLSAYKTYAWMEHTGNKDPRINSDIWAPRIMRAVDEQLAAKGYQKVDQNPDFVVGWYAALQAKIDVQTVNNYYGYGGVGYGGYWGRYYGAGAVVPSTYVQQYNEGTLILDIADVQARRVVWRGSAAAEVREGVSPEERTQRLNDAIAMILERFPPKPGSQ